MSNSPRPNHLKKTMSFNRVFGVGGGGGNSDNNGEGRGGRRKLHRLNYNNRSNANNNSNSNSNSNSNNGASFDSVSSPTIPGSPGPSNVYPILPPEYSPSVPISNSNGQAPSSPGPACGPSSPTQSALEKYSNVLLAEMRKKPIKEKALKDALACHDRIHQLESDLMFAESETVRRRCELESLLEELDRKKEEARKDIRELHEKLDQTREDTHRNIDSIRREPQFKDHAAIEKLTREIDQLTVHARGVQHAAPCASGDDVPPPPYVEREDAIAASPSSSSLKEEEQAFLCPICLSLPKDQIFSCTQCDNMICGCCIEKVNACPACRKNFRSSSPKRNRLAERLVASKRGNM